MDDDLLARPAGTISKPPRNGGKTSRSTSRRIGSNHSDSPIKETPPPMTIRRGAINAMACTRAKAMAECARARIDC